MIPTGGEPLGARAPGPRGLIAGLPARPARGWWPRSRFRRQVGPALLLGARSALRLRFCVRDGNRGRCRHRRRGGRRGRREARRRDEGPSRGRRWDDGAPRSRLGDRRLASVLPVQPVFGFAAACSMPSLPLPVPATGTASATSPSARWPPMAGAAAVASSAATTSTAPARAGGSARIHQICVGRSGLRAEPGGARGRTCVQRRSC